MKYTRITVNPEQMSGEPCIRNLRIPVATILTMLSQGLEKSKVLNYYPDLVLDDIDEVLKFAAETVQEKENH